MMHGNQACLFREKYSNSCPTFNAGCGVPKFSAGAGNCKQARACSIVNGIPGFRSMKTKSDSSSTWVTMHANQACFACEKYSSLAPGSISPAMFIVTASECLGNWLADSVCVVPNGRNKTPCCSGVNSTPGFRLIETEPDWS